MEKDWIELMIERQAIPKVLREGTVEEFCAKHNTSTQNYYYHLSKKENQEKVLELSLNRAKRAVPDILEKLIEKASEGDMKAIDIYLDSVIKLAKNLDLKTAGKPINILNGIFSDIGNKEDSEPKQEG
jgi:hypothetical protein